MNIFSFTRQKQTLVCKTKRANILFIFLIAVIGFSIPAQSQKVKNSLQLADEYFAAGEYYTAAHLYEQFLNPPKKGQTASDFPLNVKARRTTASDKNISRTDIIYKQAESYRLANYWQEAATTYKECLDKDSTQFNDALYWQAICQRNLAQYAAAAESLKNYLTTNGKHKTEAQKELQTLQYIQQQLARPDSILFKVQKLNAANINSNEKGLFAPAYVTNDQFVVSITEKDSMQVAGVNPYHSRLFYTSLKNGSLQEMTPITFPDAESAINQGAASISKDGKFLYLTQWKKENGNTVSAIYLSTNQADGWSPPTLLSSVNITGFSSKQPFCSPDGKHLYFSSDRPGGSGKFDIWYATIKDDGTTGKPVNMGSNINTSGDEQAPFYHNSTATLVFSSNGREGMGGYDLFTSKMNEATWRTPENMGHPVNSSRDDIYFFAPENAPLLNNAIFSSDRGTGCCLETYTITKAPKSKKLIGTINDCNDNTPLADATVMLKDVSGKNWQTTTDANGKYVFDLAKETFSDLTITVNKELYIDSLSILGIANTDESDLLTDLLTSTNTCIAKKPVEEKLVIKAENVVTVFFDFDKSLLKPAGTEKLDSIYNVLVEYTSATVQISGYTDGRGTVEYNKVLSDKRARACAEYLIQKGIDASRISFASFGACCPLEMEIINGRDNPDGRSVNRRALINVKKD